MFLTHGGILYLHALKVVALTLSYVPYTLWYFVPTCIKGCDSYFELKYIIFLKYAICLH